MPQMTAAEAAAEFRRRAREADALADAYEKAIAANMDLGFIDLGPALEERLADAQADLICANNRAARFSEAAERYGSDARHLRDRLNSLRRVLEQPMPEESAPDGQVLLTVGWWKPEAPTLGDGSWLRREAYENAEAADRNGYVPMRIPLR